MSRIDDFKGCCDNGCVIKRPKGMGTNAKCRCPDYKLRAFIHALKTEIDRLTMENADQEEKIEELKEDGQSRKKTRRLTNELKRQLIKDGFLTDDETFAQNEAVVEAAKAYKEAHETMMDEHQTDGKVWPKMENIRRRDLASKALFQALSDMEGKENP